ncbi:MAG: PorT family protein [Flavobacteriales bacterium]|nr:MAG: PorT family protein [Flavobacteriales bacterium]
MKKILLVSFIYLFVQHTNAQAALFALIFGDKVASENFNVGLEIGVPLSTISNAEGTSSKTGITFGIAGNIKVNDNWSVHPTAYFLSKRGGKFDELSLISNDLELNAKFQNAPTELTLNYIDVPVFLNYRFTDSPFKIGIAPQISFRTGSQAIFSNAQGDFDASVKEVTKSTDIGMILQVGYVFYSKKFDKEIHAQLRYFQGFNDIYDESFITGTNKSSYIGLALSFPFVAKTENE